MNIFHSFIICKRTNNANNATHYVTVKLGKNFGKDERVPNAITALFLQE